ncbi:MAG: hypothetical protein ABIL09_07045, partial [Gemmatimonadota bacterium]
MPVIKYRKWPLADKGTAWDGPAQIAAADVEKLKIICTWFGGDGENKGDYKLPHHLASNSHTVWKGVTAAMGRLKQTDMPEEDRRGCHSHLKRHYADFGETAPDYDELRAEALEADEVERFGIETARADLIPLENTDEELQHALGVINRRLARKPLSAEDIFIFRAQMSNQEVDSYFTRMAESSLRNYEREARDGVPLMNSHRTGGFFAGAAQLPLGRSYDAELAGDDGALRLYVDHYMLRGLKINDAETDHLIRGIDGGTIRDVSIGFGFDHKSWYRCSICGGDMLRSEKCQHLPGREYDGVLATAWVELAHLWEGSIVWAGATPNAEIVRKAQMALQRGWVTEADIRQLEESYQVRLMPRRTFAVPGDMDRTSEAEAAGPTPDE